MMKKYFVLAVIFLIVLNNGFSTEPTRNDDIFTGTVDFEVGMANNYQQFKFQVMNMQLKPDMDYSYLRKRNNSQDFTMLYVAGGLAAATGLLILTNNPDNFTSNSASGVNLGIAIGGTVACSLFVVKFFIDRNR